MSKWFVIVTLFVSLTSFNYCDTDVDCLNVDIILMGDISSSVSGNEPFLYSAMQEFANRFKLSEDGVKIGIVTFSSTATLNCHLTSEIGILKNAIDSLPKANGNTNMAQGFAVSLEELLKNGRPHCRKMLIVISDGFPDHPDDNRIIAEQIKSTNINIFGVLIKNKDSETDVDYLYPGIPLKTAGCNPEFMKDISSDNCYMESDYQHLVNQIKKLEICL